MDILRTPDERFANLPDWPYAPHYIEVPAGEGDACLRVHYVDEGPRDAPVVLMLHGEPSWSYLYRKVIREVTAAGLRAVAPDLIGFGRSDKPTRRTDYTYQRHVDWMSAFLVGIDLRDATLLCQDWGGLIGLRLVAEHPDRFARVVTANTFLPTGDQPMPDAFFAWQQFSQSVPELPVGNIVRMGCARGIPDEIAAAYDAPFPTRASKAGPRAYPPLVPFAGNVEVPAQKRAWASLEAFDKPFLCAFSDRDPITRGGDALFLGRVPGTAGQAHRTLSGGHFIQEDDPAGFAGALLEIAGKA